MESEVIPKSTLWYRANIEKARAIGRDHYHRNRESLKAKSKLWVEANKEKSLVWRGQYRVKKYGLTPTEYEGFLDKSGGRCDICQTPFASAPHIDHCHTTGSVRGLLCAGCNKALGLFKDSVPSLEAAIKYLNERK